MPVSPTPVLGLSPSLIAASPVDLGKAVSLAVQAGATALHIDIMDGHFVPNLTYGPDVVKALRPLSNMFFDVHLMVKNPGFWATPFIKAGANAVTIHIEATPDWLDIANTIRSQNCQAGIAVKPDTPFSLIPDEAWGQIDRLLIMTVEPGFSGQSFMPIWDKIHEAALIKLKHPHLIITVDGGVNGDNVAQLAKSGIDMAVIGSAFYHSTAPLDAWADLRSKIEEING